jgi:photosystem II stability/assembly factor-like uncharacterized protein
MPSGLWITTRQGAFHSRDHGASWEHVVAGNPAKNLYCIRYDAGRQRLLGVARTGEIYSASDGGRTWTQAADPGWQVRRVTVAGERLLGITAFSGIVGQRESAQSSRAAISSGSSQ